MKESVAGGVTITKEDEALIASWICDAQQRQPDIQAWGRLIAALRWAMTEETRGVHDPHLPKGMDACAIALIAIGDFLNAHEFIVAEKINVPVGRLQAAVRDVVLGYRPPLLTPVTKPERRATSVEANVSGIAARALEELLLAEESATDAPRMVVRAMKDGRVAGHEKCTPTKVKNWRFACREGAGGSIHEGAVERFRAPLPAEAGDTPRDKARWLLAALRHSPYLRHP